MKIASVAEVKARLSVYLKASEEGPVVVTRDFAFSSDFSTPHTDNDGGQARRIANLLVRRRDNE